MIRVYGVAFALLLAAGAALVVASLGALSSMRLLWLSAGLSAGAILVSVLSVALKRR